MDYAAAFRRPFLDFKKLIIGVLLAIIPIINFLSFGYVLEALRTKGKLPEWNNWGDLFVKGLLAFVIGIIYSVPSSIIFLLGFLFLMVAGWSIIFTILSVSAYILGGLVLLIAFYLMPAAIVVYAKTDDFKSAFMLKEIFAYAFRGSYFIPWLVGLLYFGLLNVLVGWIPFLGMSFASFVGLMTLMTMIGEA